MSVTFLEAIISKNFGKMPLTVRIITYLCLMSLLIYNSLLPEFINGEIRIEDDEGYIPFTLGKASMIIEGKNITSETDSRGIWSLPLLNKMQKYQTIRFEYRDKNREWKSYDLSFDILKTIFRKHLIVYHNPNSSQKFYIKDERNKGELDYKMAESSKPIRLNRYINIPQIYAQTITLSENVRLTEEVLSTLNETVIRENIQINQNTNLFEDLDITLKEEIILKNRIETKFGIELNVREWDKIETVRDLVNQTEKYSIPSSNWISEEIGFAYYGIQNNDGSWMTRYFENETRMKTERPEVGDFIRAIGDVNIREGYIEHEILRGWVNKETIGLITLNDRLLVREVKLVAGNYVWIKFTMIE